MGKSCGKKSERDDGVDLFRRTFLEVSLTQILRLHAWAALDILNRVGLALCQG